MKKIILLVETSREFGRQLICGIAGYSRINGPWSFYREPSGLISSVPRLTTSGADMINPSMNKQIVLRELNFGVWWGILLLIVGMIYFINFRPWKKR